MKWKKIGKGNQYEKGDLFTAISKPAYSDKYLVTTGNRTKSKSIKRSWTKTKADAQKRVVSYRKRN